MSLGRFEGQVALITGASRGIGFAVAQRLVSEGARVCITARKQPALEAAVAELGGPTERSSRQVPATTREHRAAAVEATMAAFGRLDVLVNNTGINPTFGPLLEIEDRLARKMFDVNVLSALAWMRLAHRAVAGRARRCGGQHRLGRGPGRLPGIAFYGITKAALVNLTRQLAVDSHPGSGQCGRPGGGEDQVRRGAVRRQRGGGRGRLPAQASR